MHARSQSHSLAHERCCSRVSVACDAPACGRLRMQVEHANALKHSLSAEWELEQASKSTGDHQRGLAMSPSPDEERQAAQGLADTDPGAPGARVLARCAFFFGYAQTLLTPFSCQG